ncbi:hypothetical protein Q1695_002791 [Nippostrongylus brasiliensis]|nr:hypothetical protein Q1695_002791 [Nippostrongylus brasiliensis]
MMMLSYIVLVTDHLPFYTFATVFGNTIQMNRNEMPWHSCSLPYSTEDCQPISPCLSAIIKDTADTFGQSSDYFHELGRYEYGTVVYGGECIRLQAREFDPLRGRSDVKAEYTALNERDSTYSYLTNQAGLISAPNLVFAYPTPNQYVALFCVLTLLVFLSMRGRGFVVKCCFITAGLTYVLMIGFILSVLWTPSHQHHSWLNAKDSLFNPKMWSSALLLTLNVLRIGQSGLHSLGAQNHFKYNVLIDAFVVVVYVVFGALIFAYVHLTLTSSGGLMTAHFNPELFDKLHEAKLAENIYYQMFNWWYAIANMAVYQHYEPYAQFAFSALCMLLAINCTFVWLELFVSSCLTSLDSLADSSSQTLIYRTTILCFALPYFLVRSKLGFHTLVAVENTIIPIATGVVVTLELVTVGLFYGFYRIWSNISSMETNKDEEESMTHRLCGVFFIINWTVTPFLIILAMIFAYPHPHPDATNIVIVIFVIVFTPVPVFALLKILYVLHRNIPSRALYNPDQNLWGPRNEENRAQAALWERKINVRQRW